MAWKSGGEEIRNVPYLADPIEGVLLGSEHFLVALVRHGACHNRKQWPINLGERGLGLGFGGGWILEGS